jgi:isopentenyldiphosphate isomerase
MKIPIVNEQDEIIGYKERKDLDTKDICRISGLWVTDKDGNILLAQRSFNKKHDPGKWGPAVAGTVEEGETYESNILKEAEEEIGLVNINPIMGNKYRRSTSHEFFAQWFFVIVDHDYLFKKQDNEVEELRWFSKAEILNLFDKKPEMFTKSLKLDSVVFLK